MTSHNSINGLVDDYSQLRAVPALLGIVFAMASLYQFGGVSELTLEWFSYTLTDQHAMLVSLGVLVVAFMSSQTKQFENYQDWEQILILATPSLVIGYHYIGFVESLVNTAEPWGQVAAFLVCVAGYASAMR